MQTSRVVEAYDGHDVTLLVVEQRRVSADTSMAGCVSFASLDPVAVVACRETEILGFDMHAAPLDVAALQAATPGLSAALDRVAGRRCGR